MKKKNLEMIKDDDLLREEGMADGAMTILDNIELRPITALSVSWMQRNEIFNETKDMIWKSAAFAFLHSAPFTAIRQVVNDRSAFIDAVDVWIERNLTHHAQATNVANIMNQAFTRYMAAASETSATGSAAGN
jgi:hypothetical protein